MSIRLYGAADNIAIRPPYVPVKAAAAMTVKKGQLLSVDGNGEVKAMGTVPDTTIGFLTVRAQTLKADEVFDAYEITPNTYLAVESTVAAEIGDDLTLNAAGTGIIATAAKNKKQAVAVRNQADSKNGEVVFRIKAISLISWKNNANT